MGRKVVLLTALIAAALLNLGPAEAKILSLHHVEVTGPGIDGTLRVTPEEFGRIRNENSPASIALDGVYSPFEKEPRPQGELGPRFDITYVQEYVINDRDIVRVTAHLYPYAEAGPVTFIVPDQPKEPKFADIPQRVTRAGWLPYPEELVENLRAAGLPSEQEAEQAMETSASSAWPWLAAGAALAVVLWGVGSGRVGGRGPVLGRGAGHDDRAAVGVLR